MADEDDYAVAVSGEKDLVGFVLDNADFRKKPFWKRTFLNPNLNELIFHMLFFTVAIFEMPELHTQSFFNLT